MATGNKGIAEHTVVRRKKKQNRECSMEKNLNEMESTRQERLNSVYLIPLLYQKE